MRAMISAGDPPISMCSMQRWRIRSPQSLETSAWVSASTVRLDCNARCAQGTGCDLIALCSECGKNLVFLRCTDAARTEHALQLRDDRVELLAGDLERSMS